MAALFRRVHHGLTGVLLADDLVDQSIRNRNLLGRLDVQTAEQVVVGFGVEIVGDQRVIDVRPENIVVGRGGVIIGGDFPVRNRARIPPIVGNSVRGVRFRL